MPTAAPPAPPKPKIPSLSKLTGATAPTEKLVPPVAPDANVAPPIPEVTPPVIPPTDEMPDIPTSIVGAHQPKPERAIIEQRRAAKAAKEETAVVSGEAEQFKIELATTKTELEKLRKERELALKEKGDFEALAKTRADEVEETRRHYADSQKPQFDVASDQTFVDAHTKMMENLRANIPGYVKGANGKENRVFFDTVAQQNGKLTGLHNILDTYNKAQGATNEEGMDMAVNAFAQWLGADVDMTSADKNQWKVLSREDSETRGTFLQIEQALQKAAPHYQQKSQRFQEVQQQAPQLALQQFQQRSGKLREAIHGQVFLSKDDATARLKTDPNDSIALFSLIVEQVPELKTDAEAFLAGASETLATVSDNLYLPTLKSSNREDVQAHQQQIRQHQQNLSRLMSFAMVGAKIGPIISTLLGERDAAEERANAAASNTNPGDTSRAGGAGNGAGVPEIPTSIVGAERR